LTDLSSNIKLSHAVKEILNGIDDLFIEIIKHLYTSNLGYDVTQRGEQMIHLGDKRGGKMKISARNILKGKVVKVVRGAVNSEVIIELPGGTRLVSIITNSSVENLSLTEGKEAYAIIKASNVMIGID
jgi:molybdopterin-binding protein